MVPLRLSYVRVKLAMLDGGHENGNIAKKHGGSGSSEVSTKVGVVTKIHDSFFVLL